MYLQPHLLQLQVRLVHQPSSHQARHKVSFQAQVAQRLVGTVLFRLSRAQHPKLDLELQPVCSVSSLSWHSSIHRHRRKEETKRKECCLSQQAKVSGFCLVSLRYFVCIALREVSIGFLFAAYRRTIRGKMPDEHLDRSDIKHADLLRSSAFRELGDTEYQVRTRASEW